MVFCLPAADEVQEENGHVHTVYLTSTEKLNLKLVPPTVTLDWFQGNPQDIEQSIRSKMDSILSYNPWLTGQYNRGGDRFQYSTLERYFDVEDMLVLVDPQASPIHKTTTSYNELIQLGQRQDLGWTAQLKNPASQPFWKVAIVPDADSPTTHFVMYVSLSLGVGDGYVFYSLYNMLVGGGTSCWAMTPERIPTTMQQQEEAMGKAEAHYGGTLGVALLMFWGMLKGLMTPKKNKCQPRIFLVDNQIIQRKKQDYQQQKQHQNQEKSVDEARSYISTNDILTSGVILRSKCNHGAMAMNLRGRLEGHTKEHAFNAENDIFFYCPDDVATPADIRIATHTMKRKSAGKTKMTGLTLGGWNDDLCFVTNWSTFKSDDYQFEGLSDESIQHLVHLPAYDVTDVPVNVVLGVIFKPRKGQIAVLVIGTNEKQDLISNADFESSTPFELFVK